MAMMRIGKPSNQTHRLYGKKYNGRIVGKFYTKFVNGKIRNNLPQPITRHIFS